MPNPAPTSSPHPSTNALTLDSQPTNRAIRTRLFTAVVAGLVLIVLLAISSIGLIVASQQSNAARIQRVDGIRDARQDLTTSIAMQQVIVFDFEITRAARAFSEFEQASRDEATAEARLANLAQNDPALASVLSDVAQRATTWRRDWVGPLIELLETGAPGPTSGGLSHETGDALFAKLEVAIAALDQAITERRASAALDQEIATRTVVTIIAAASATAGLIVIVIWAWLLRTVSGPLGRLSRTAADLVAGRPVSFRAEREDEIGTLARVLEQLRLDVDSRYVASRTEAERAATFNKLGDLISFSSSEPELVEAAIRAVRQLTAIPDGDIQLANPSQNRLTVAGAWGDHPTQTGPAVPIDRIDRCPGIRRASAYVMPDVTDDLAVRCPAYSATVGATACVPMMALGQVLGVIHLQVPDGTLGQATVSIVARVAEQVALALSNARLLKALESLAMTDSLTGLHNARFFDPFLEQQLVAAERDGEPLAVLMVDIDHFKKFNDTHGHPAGDEALRAFGRAITGVLRASDVVARYGGEEFIVALPNAGADEAVRVAEKIRATIEQTIIEIGPGRYARMTVSVGVVATDVHRLDQKGLVAMADAALYRAKEEGRNRVSTAPISEGELETAARRRRGRPVSDPPTTIPLAAEG